MSTNTNKEKALFKDKMHKYLQGFVLATKDLPFFSWFYNFLYSYAEKLFVRFARKAEKEVSSIPIIESIYLRRGGGRSELIPGASDLDFFIVLKTVSAEQEMLFLKEFWDRYSEKRLLFPFLGETLMGDRNELENWFQTRCVRAYETSHSWKLLWGENTLAKLPKPFAPDLRDIFSECLKCYWSLLQPVLKLQTENLENKIEANSYGAVHLRHAIKSAIDIFRMHYASELPAHQQEKIHKASRVELLEILPSNQYGGTILPRFKNLLELRSPIFADHEAFTHFSEIIYIAYQCLHQLASRLEKNSEEKETGQNWQVVYHAKKREVDAYSLSVRELFAERLLFRHNEIMSRVILSESTAHMYFPLHGIPSKEKFFELLYDLRDVSFSLDRFSVPMPVSDICFRQLEKTSLLDTPFHSFYSHKELVFEKDGNITTRDYNSPPPAIPENMLRKTFAELSFTLRLQPQPKQFEHFLEKIVTLALSLRISYGMGKIVTDFHSALDIFGQKYPSRSEHLRSQMSGYFYEKQAAEEELWGEMEGLLQKLETHDATRATFLRSQLQNIRATNALRSSSPTIATDLWINITPFLRMEMNAVKDRCFPVKPSLRL